MEDFRACQKRVAVSATVLMFEFGIGTRSGDSTTDRMTPQRCMRHVSFVIFTYEPLIV